MEQICKLFVQTIPGGCKQKEDDRVKLLTNVSKQPASAAHG